MKVKCCKCGNERELPQEYDRALADGTGNIRKWYNRGKKYGFLCWSCHDIFRKESQAVFPLG